MRRKSDALIADIEKKACPRAPRVGERLSEPARGARGLWCGLSTPRRADFLFKNRIFSRRGTPIYPAANTQPSQAAPRSNHVICCQPLPSEPCCHRCEPRVGAVQPRHAADTTRCSIAGCGCCRRCALLDHCAPCVRSTFVNQGGRGRVGAAFEAQRMYLGGRSRRTQRTAADRATVAQGPASGCSIEVIAAILYGGTATPAK